MTSPTFWLVVGFLGQATFTARFLVQWIASEKKRDSVVPVAFWWLSLLGGLALLSYAISRRDPVIIVGQAMGLFVYVRNLMLVGKAARSAGAVRRESDSASIGLRGIRPSSYRVEGPEPSLPSAHITVSGGWPGRDRLLWGMANSAMIEYGAAEIGARSLPGLGWTEKMGVTPVSHASTREGRGAEVPDLTWSVGSPRPVARRHG